mmetsp:Transcript_26815/g.48327  ORF Transcript_26815/g.48327 Transcript_26815/m.48327 type:complete len:800 (+) Transcript_26815:79-2478(+)
MAVAPPIDFWQLNDSLLVSAVLEAKAEFSRHPLNERYSKAIELFEANIRMRMPRERVKSVLTTYFSAPEGQELDLLVFKRELKEALTTGDFYQIIELPKSYELRQKIDAQGKTTPTIGLQNHQQPIRQYYSPLYGGDSSTFFDLYSKAKVKKPKNIVICVSMYNEGPAEVTRTLEGIAKSLQPKGKPLHKESIEAKEMLCVIICDGIEPFMKAYDKHKDFFSPMFDMGQIDPAFKNFNKDDRLFNGISLPNILYRNAGPEYIKSDDTVEYSHCFRSTYTTDKRDISFDVVWVVKQGNKRKLNTHYWFFEGFCKVINPDYVILLDIGTGPCEYALGKLIGAMENNKNIAGCCGEIVPYNPQFLNMVECAQMVEYKFAHIFDKALESLIGFITVLPGAFSAYSWKALEGRPLEKYFYSILYPENMDCFKANVYLAEDRILCAELIFKKGASHILRFIFDAKAETDVPSDIFVLLAQRRRWFNGSRFAIRRTLESMRTVREAAACVCKTENDHNGLRQALFSFMILYYLMNAVISYFSVGLFFLAFSLLVRQEYPQEADSTDAIDDLFTFGDTILKLLFTGIVLNIIIALGASPKVMQESYKYLMVFYGCFMGVILYFFIKFVTKGEYEGWVLYSTLLTILAFMLIPLIYGELFSVALRIMHFLLLTPTYMLMFQIYARCNVNDCTWGNRPDKMTNEEQKRKTEFAIYRAKKIIVWALLNVLIGAILNLVDSIKGLDELTEGLVIYFFGIFGGLSLGIRVLGSILYLVQEKCRSTKRVRTTPDSLTEDEMQPLNSGELEVQV